MTLTRPLRTPFALLLTLAFAAPVSPGHATGDDPPGEAPGQVSQLDAVKGEALALFKDRLNPKSAKAGIDALVKWQALDPNNPEPVVLESQLILFYVSYLEAVKDPEARLTLFSQGLEHCRSMQARFPKEPSLDFWAAVMLATWSRENGVMSSLSSFGEMTERLDRVEAVDPDHYYGGISRFWGRVIQQVPGSLRTLRGYSLEDAEALLLKAIEEDSRYILTHFYLGQVYLDMGEREKAKAALLKAVNGDVNAIPAVTPENTVNQRRAAKFYAQEFGE